MKIKKNLLRSMLLVAIFGMLGFFNLENAKADYPAVGCVVFDKPVYVKGAAPRLPDTLSQSGASLLGYISTRPFSDSQIIYILPNNTGILSRYNNGPIFGYISSVKDSISTITVWSGVLPNGLFDRSGSLYTPKRNETWDSKNGEFFMSPSPVTYNCSCPSGGTLIGTTCITAPVVNGSCGSENGTTSATTPTTFTCDSGTKTGLSGTGPWTWSCLGSGGTTATCTINKTVSVDGICATPPNGSSLATLLAGSCNQGIYANFLGLGPWTWSCLGSNGGVDANCTASKTCSSSCVFSAAQASNYCTGQGGGIDSCSGNACAVGTKTDGACCVPDTSCAANACLNTTCKDSKCGTDVQGTKDCQLQITSWREVSL